MNSTLSVIETIDWYLSEQSICQQSRRTYRAALIYFFSYLTGSDIWNPGRKNEVRLVTTAMIVSFMDTLNKRNISVCSTGLYIAVIKRFFNWTSIKGIHENVAAGVKGPKRYKGLSKDPLTLEQAKLFFNSINRTSDIGKRNFAIASLLLLNGLRSIEVSRCDVRDLVNEHGIKSIFIQGKGHLNKDEKVPITNEVYNAIMAYHDTKHGSAPNDPLFLTHGTHHRDSRVSTRIITKMVHTILTRTGLKTQRISTHSLRHTAANIAIQNGVEMPALKAFMRHSSYTVTEIYIQQIQQKNISDCHVSRVLTKLIEVGEIQTLPQY